MPHQGKYFSQITFTLDIPTSRPLSKDLLEARMEQLHRPDPDLTLSEHDSISIIDIIDNGKLTAYKIDIGGAVSFAHDEGRIQRLEDYMMEVFQELAEYTDKTYPVQAYLTLHRDYISRQ